MPVRTSKSKASKRGAPKKSAVRKSTALSASLNSALAEAAWREADAALALALVDLDEALTSRGAKAREALECLSQSLSRAARKRGLTRLGDLDAQVNFDPAIHALNATVAKPPKKVRIQARGVTRGGEVLEKPRVVPKERKKRP